MSGRGASPEEANENGEPDVTAVPVETAPARDEEDLVEGEVSLGGYPREPQPLPDEGEELVPGEMYTFSIDYWITNEAERERVRQLRREWLERRRLAG